MGKVTFVVPPEGSKLHDEVHNKDTKKEKKNLKKSLKNWDKRLNEKINKYKSETKYDENYRMPLLGAELPSALSNFVRANTARFKILVRSLEVFPFELVMHVIHDINIIAMMLFIGFLAIALWMAFEEIAIYGGEQVLLVIFTVFQVVVVVLDLIVDFLVVFVLGPILGVIQFMVCDPAGVGFGIKQAFRSDFTEVICNDIPGPGNPTIIPIPKQEDFIPEIWDFMKRSKDTCAEFSTGLEELQVMPKLFLSPLVCPILQHVRPVPWLYDIFWYSLGWATWAQGIERTYEAPWASAVTNQVMTDGIKNNRKCEPPPNALFCFILGFGFLIVEVMVPVLILMLAFKPLKDAISASIGIGFSIVIYSINFVLWLMEKVTHVIDWAGRRFAWIVVLLVPLSITAPVGYQLYGEDGVFGGSIVGILAGLGVVLEHTPNEKNLGGPSHGTIIGVAAVAVAMLAGGGAINRYL